MKKQFRIFLCLATVLVVALCLLAACNNTNGQNQDGNSNSSNENPPICGDDDDTNEPPIEEEKCVSINSIWNEFFSETSFADDLQAAYNTICEKAFTDLDAEVKDVKYNSAANTVSLSVSYYEYDAIRTGTINFEAPRILNQLEGSGDKFVVLEIADYLSTTQIKESEIANAKTKIANAIASIRTTISEEFSSLQKSDLSTQKEEVRFITYGEIYDEYYCNLSFDEDIKETLNIYTNMQLGTHMDSLVFYDFDWEDNKIYLYVDHLGTSESMRHQMQKYYVIISEVIKNAKLDTKNMVFSVGNIVQSNQISCDQISHGVEKLDCTIETVKIIIKDSILSLSMPELCSMDDFGVCQTAVKPEYSKQLAHKLFPDKEVLASYFSYPGTYGFDHSGFNSSTGYTTSFRINIFYAQDNNVIHYISTCILNYYIDHPETEFYYESYLNGVETLEGSGRYRFTLANEDAKVICEKFEYVNDIMKYGEIVKTTDFNYVVYDNVAYITGYNGDSNITSLVVPARINEFKVEGIRSFNNKSMQEIILPNTLKIIAWNSFMNCKSLNHIEFGGVEYIGACAFTGCNALQDVEITAVSYIGPAFYNCTNLSKVTIGKQVKFVNGEAFVKNDNLINCLIDDNPTYFIENNCIINRLTKTVVHGLNDAVIPNDESVMCIGNNAFNESSLIEITIPISITNIGERAFYSCRKLKKFIYQGTVAQWNNIFKGVNWDLYTGEYIIECSDGTLTKEQTHGSQDFTTLMDLENDVTTINQSVDILETVPTIGLVEQKVDKVPLGNENNTFNDELSVERTNSLIKWRNN